MRVLRLHFPVALFVLMIILVSPGVTLAQGNDICPTIVSQSLTQTGVNCATSESGTACIASEPISSLLAPTADATTFDEAGETISLAEVISLSPSAVDTVEQTWGISVLNLQANLPVGFEEDVVLIGLGGLEIENDAEGSHMFTPLAEPVTVTTTAASDLRAVTLSAPAISDIIGQVASGVTLPADAISEDGAWVRVVSNGDPGWVIASALDGDLSSLPAYGPNNLTSFQSFYFRTGVDGSPCAQAPSLVVIQGPRDIPVDLVINDVNIRIESTIVVRTLPPGTPVGAQMQLIVLSGLARINPDTEDEIIIPPGFFSLISLGPEFFSFGAEGDEDERGPAPTDFGVPTLITQGLIDELGILGRLPGNLLNYIVSLPRLVIPSGIGQAVTRLLFSDARALALVRTLCENNTLPDNICQAFGL